MFVVIVVSTLVTLLVLIITSICYLITVLSDDADEDIDNLNLTQGFNSSPTISPDLLNSPKSCPHLRQHNHDSTQNHCLCHENHDQASPDNRGISSLPMLGVNDEKKLIADRNGKAVPQSNQEPLAPASNVDPASTTVDESAKLTVASQLSQWYTTSSAQKNLISTHLGSSAAKQLFGDFDTKEMQLGGTGLHWCKSRKSLDKLMQMGVPINLINNRQETALHVAVRKRRLQVLIGLLCHDADVNLTNADGETPLFLAVRLNDVFACQLLLIFDSNVNAIDTYGLSVRHYAARQCFKSKSQQQPNASHLILAMLHSIGANRCKESHDTIDSTSKERIKLGLAGRRLSTFLTCNDGCAANGSFNGNNYDRWPDFNKESLNKLSMSMDLIRSLREQTLTRSQNQCSKNIKPEISRLLCIDGGGMRGVLVCQMLIDLEKYLKRPVVDYFDWMGGTSAGAFIAGALCTGKSLRDLRRICFDVKDEVFNGSRPYNHKLLERVFKATLGPTTRMSDIKHKRLAITTVIADTDPCQLRIFRNYSSQSDLLDQHGFAAEVYNNMSSHSIVVRKCSSTSVSHKTAGLNQISGKSGSNTGSGSDSTIKSTSKGLTTTQTTILSKVRDSKQATVKSAKTTQTVKSLDSIEDDTGTSQENKGESPNEVVDENEKDPLLWQAVRASGAAPFFFKPYGPYLDGGIISNNPTLDMMTEFFNLEGTKRFLRNRPPRGAQNTSVCQIDPPRKLELVVSFGTGRGRIVGRQAMIDFGAVASGFATVFSPVELVKSIRAARDLFKKLMQQSCHTDDYIIDRAQAWCSSIDVPYFRINPPLTTIFPIDDKRDEQLINALWQSKLYMHIKRPQLRELADLLDSGTDAHLVEAPGRNG